MQLCSNRPEGFVCRCLPSNHNKLTYQGPASTLSSPLPTTCFTDTILLPLPVWLALALLPLLYLVGRSYNKTHFNPSTIALRVPPSKRRLCLNFTSATYYILIVANILMQTLEIVRLELLDFGIGLLPFVFVGLLLGGSLHYTGGISRRIIFWEVINAVVWVGGIVMCIIQVVGLTNEGINGRKGSKYPVSDQVIDVAVMAGVYAVIGILEVVLGMWRRTRERAVKAELAVEERKEFVELELSKAVS